MWRRGYLSCRRLLILTSSTAVLSAITWTTRTAF
jgi:hypothetical protein